MQELTKIYGDTLLLENNFSYCPGCGHGIVTRLIAETIETLNIRERSIAIVGIGCGGFSHHYMNIDAIEAMHGRAASVAVGYKTALPENIVFTYSGDGDTSAIGLADMLHAANRGLPMTCFMINNCVFGMTGGQMSPTSLENQITATTPKGRDPKYQGFPLRLPEMMVGMKGVKYLARESVADVKSIRKAGESIKKAFECQTKGIGFAFVEFTVPCPTGLKMNVADSFAWCANDMNAYFVPQIFKNELES